MSASELRELMYQSIKNLATDEGILASGRDEAFGAIFGRDTAITVMKLLQVYRHTADPYLLDISKKGLLALVRLQGREENAESGEQPGKFIHEFRRDRYEHLLALEKPWFLYEDATLRNYDSIDSTPLGLIALFQYWEVSRDDEFLQEVLPAVVAGLEWILTYADADRDGILEFFLEPTRLHGGLSVHSWTDSYESFAGIDGKLPQYPIAPVEVQAFGWLALKLWADFYSGVNPRFARRLTRRALRMKTAFNKHFIIRDRGVFFAAQGLDGEKQPIATITANPLLALWASYRAGGHIESIVAEAFIPDFVRRGFEKDLFDSESGIRTMSTESPTYNPKEDSYHNGSFWPMVNGLIYEGLLNFGFEKEAEELKQAALKPIIHFGSPVELYHRSPSGYLEYRSSSGQVGCREQAWSAASILHMVME